MNVLTSIMDDMNDSENVTFASDDRRFVYAVARRIVRSADDAEDVTQEALLLAFRHRNAFRGESRYRTWLYRIAATAALGHLRRQKRARLTVVSSDLAHETLERQPDAAKLPSTLLEEAESRIAVRQALGELAPTYREVLIARADSTESEVAAKLGISVGNVKIRTHRAKKQLRATMDRLEQAANDRATLERLEAAA